MSMEILFFLFIDYYVVGCRTYIMRNKTWFRCNQWKKRTQLKNGSDETNTMEILQLHSFSNIENQFKSYVRDIIASQCECQTYIQLKLVLLARHDTLNYLFGSGYSKEDDETWENFLLDCCRHSLATHIIRDDRCISSNWPKIKFDKFYKFFVDSSTFTFNPLRRLIKYYLSMSKSACLAQFIY